MKMNRRTVFIIVLIVLSLASVGCVSAKISESDESGVRHPVPSGPTVVAETGAQQTGIWVTGEGSVYAEPDIAILTLGIEAQAGQVDQARSQAADAMDQVMQSLRKSGVAERDIQTTQFSIYPVRKWNQDTEEQILVGFRVSNVLTVKIRAIEDTGLIIDSVVQAGGDLTRIQDITFSIENASIFQEQAREQAVVIARAKAEQLAHTAGARLGMVTYISESGGYNPVHLAVPAVDETASTSTPISPGQQEISISVQIAYAIELE